jgi:hypothetical protein
MQAMAELQTGGIQGALEQLGKCVIASILRKHSESNQTRSLMINALEAYLKEVGNAMAVAGTVGTLVMEAAILEGSTIVLEAVVEAVDRVGAMKAAASRALGTLVLETAIKRGSKVVLKAVEEAVDRVGAMKAAAPGALGTLVLEAAIKRGSTVVLEAVEREKRVLSENLRHAASQLRHSIQYPAHRVVGVAERPAQKHEGYASANALAKAKRRRRHFVWHLYHVAEKARPEVHKGPQGDSPRGTPGDSGS